MQTFYFTNTCICYTQTTNISYHINLSQQILVDTNYIAIYGCIFHLVKIKVTMLISSDLILIYTMLFPDLQQRGY